MALRVHAPGKLLLFGDYAVVYGAPALVLAIDRYAHAEAHSSTDGWRITAPDVGVVNLALRFSAGSWQVDASHEIGERLKLAIATLNESLRVSSETLVSTAALQHFRLDTSSFFHGTAKLGFGSSAALCVALSSLCRQIAGQSLAPEAVFDASYRAHARVGGGSGADLAASCLGGVVHYRKSPRLMESLPTPADLGLHTLAVFTGVPASTANLLGQVEAQRAADPAGFERVLQPLADLSEHAVEHWQHARAEKVVALTHAYTLALMNFGAWAGIDIVSKPHQTLRDLAQKCGVGYKSSGAGVGDVGVALATDPAALADFSHAAREAGYWPIEVGVGQGLL